MWIVVLGTCWIQKQVHWLDFPFWIPGLQERKEGSGAGSPSLSVVALLRGMEASAHGSPTSPAPRKENWHQEGICQLWNQHCLAPALFILFSTEPEQPGKIIFMQKDKRTWQEWILIRFLKNNQWIGKQKIYIMNFKLLISFWNIYRIIIIYES